MFFFFFFLTHFLFHLVFDNVPLQHVFDNAPSLSSSGMLSLELTCMHALFVTHVCAVSIGSFSMHCVHWGAGWGFWREGKSPTFQPGWLTAHSLTGIHTPTFPAFSSGLWSHQLHCHKLRHTHTHILHQQLNMPCCNGCSVGFYWSLTTTCN